MTPRQVRSRVTVAVLIVVSVLFASLGDPYTVHVGTLFLMYTLLAMGLSIVVVYAGLLDLGYVAFFATGAYFYAVLNTSVQLPFGAALPGAAVLAALLGLLLGYPTLRVRGDYLAVVTLAFGEIVRQVLENWVSVTGGPKGRYGIAPPSIGELAAGLPSQYFYIALVAVAIGVVIMIRLRASLAGAIWGAIRDNEDAARCCGIDPRRWLLAAFAIGAAFAGTAGVLFASVQRFVSPESFTLDESVLVLSIVVLAGGKSLPRLFLAAALLYGAPEALREFQEFRTLVFGALLIVFTVADHNWHRIPTRSTRGGSVDYGLSTMVPFPEALRSANGPAITLICKEVRKGFDGTRALDGLTVTARFEAGPLALIGPNGAGKTTIVNCISGLVSPDSGGISVQPIGDVAGLAPHQIAELGVARTFQRMHLFGTMTVREHLVVASLCSAGESFLTKLWCSVKRTLPEARSRADGALAYLQLEEVADSLATTLPIGFQRRTEIARALAARPSLLLLDEVASGLTDREKTELAQVLLRIAKDGRVSILLIEHDMAFIRMLAGTAIVMMEGRVVAQGPLDDVLADSRVRDAYLGMSRA